MTWLKANKALRKYSARENTVIFAEKGRIAKSALANKRLIKQEHCRFMTYVGHFLSFLKVRLQKCLVFKKSAPQSTYSGRVEIGGNVYAPHNFVRDGRYIV